MSHTINYTGSFLIFWGLALAGSLIVGGLLTLAYSLIALLMIHTHENAHAKACQKRGIEIKKIEFTGLGGIVDCGEMYAHEAVSVLLAGLKNTLYYQIGFAALALFLWQYRFVGINYANNPYLNLLNAVAAFSFCLVICNCLPISYHSKKYGLISTDGWAAYLYSGYSREMLNTGKYDALQVSDPSQKR